MAAAPAASADTTTTATYTVWQWNVSGNVMNAGSTSDGMVSAAVSSILNRDADFVSFNEICYSQYKAIQADLAGTWTTAASFSRFAASEAPKAGLCGSTTDDTDNSFGIALFSKQALGTSSQYTLPSDGSPEDRKMLCAPLAAQPDMVFCTVHITTSPDLTDGVANNVRQLEYVRSTLDGFDAAGETYIIAGDFNAQPNYGRLNDFYDSSIDTVANPNNTGSNFELDDTDTRCPGYGEATAAPGSKEATPPCGGNAKIDEIFVRSTRVAPNTSYSADALAIPVTCTSSANPGTLVACSDHNVLTGTVTVTIG
ncbi:endonuclease/exonuclease/phosphatase family protein [Actinospica robiniae]|uniref:Endonuclease/exonuclease/phosphatase domain-containing protein n=1 Tax=Actinospica robiniae DSM 44927 TaxID=479430 RepID=W9E528_9ACTN|nr:endonuclease/exonuclease/phosphatase family protein [Actinospica robiniae]ETA71166.1 hypothetical protein ActroDRAFT_0195 [Actinospica robiniae DSM 44927]